MLFVTEYKNMTTEIEIAAESEDWDSVIQIAKSYKLSKCWFDRAMRAAYNKVLNIAARKNKTDVFSVLLNSGASAVSFRDDSGNYAIHYAIMNKNVDILGLLSNIDNLKLKNKAGKTAIELASDLGYWELVIVLGIVESDLVENKKSVFFNEESKQKPLAASNTIISENTLCRNYTNRILFSSIEKPSIAQLKKTYQSNVRFFSFQTNRIFKGNNVNKIIQRLRERDKGNGSASEKTLEEFRLR